MSEAEAKIKVNGSITPETKIVLPLPLQITIIISIIIITSSVVGGYFKMTGNIDNHEEKIKTLQDGKLDKTTYDKDRSNDKIFQEINSKKLDAIMKKLNVDNY